MPRPENISIQKETIPTIERFTRAQLVSQLGKRVKNFLYPVGEDYLNSPHKRMLDIVGSIVLTPIALPLIAGAATLIKLEDGGPVFYIVRSNGKNNEEFGMVKLRSMAISTPSSDEILETSAYKQQDDPRITKVGRLIRLWSIDELPQIINILRGEMSLVGNRPMFPEKVNRLSDISTVSKKIYPEWVQKYHIAKPGAAGLATSRGRAELDQSDAGLRRRLHYETFYITHASLGFDIKLISDTLRAALSRQGAF